MTHVRTPVPICVSNCLTASLVPTSCESITIDQNTSHRSPGTVTCCRTENSIWWYFGISGNGWALCFDQGIVAYKNERFHWSKLGTSITSSEMCPPEPVTVNLRIEGKDKTIFEGPVTTTYHRVTTLSGQTHHCDGLNNDNNPCAGPTCITALDDASKTAGYSFDGLYDGPLDDFLITMIGGEKPVKENKEFWSLCINFRPTPVGGCQRIVKPGDQVLFAYANASDHQYPTKDYLRLWGPKDPVPPGKVILTVTDGKGKPMKDVKIDQIWPKGDRADLHGPKSDEYGKVTLNFGAANTYKLKAMRDDDKRASIRSNEFVLVVKAPTV